MADQDDKTEEPTSKRKSETRKKGDVPKSQDLNSGAVLAFGLLALWLFGGRLSTGLSDFMVAVFRKIPDFDASNGNMVEMGYWALEQMAWVLYPILLFLVFAGVGVNIAQTGWLLSGEKLKPKFDKIFKMQGLKKMFSPSTIVELLKNMAKMIIVVWIAFDVISSRFLEIMKLVEKELYAFIGVLLSVMGEIALKVTALMLLLGIIDFIYQKRKHHKQMMMTKQEVKDERKQSEGDPKLKQRIRQVMMEMHQKMMMNEVPKATVVITNPTFLAIAVAYKRGVDRVPRIVAKGKRKAAERIRELAKENDIPIMEDKPLARAMFDVVEVGETVPEEFFNAVAEVLAYVYGMQEGGSRSEAGKVQAEYA